MCQQRLKTKEPVVKKEVKTPAKRKRGSAEEVCFPKRPVFGLGFFQCHFHLTRQGIGAILFGTIEKQNDYLAMIFLFVG